MSPVKHAAASGIISIFFAYFSKSVPGAVTCFLSGILIDLDHSIDYFLIKRKIFVTYKELKHFFTYVPEGRIKLLFHSYELLAVLWLAWFFVPANMILLGLALGVSLHLILDVLSNPLRLLSYSFIYRLKHKFAREKIFVEHYFENLS